MARKRTGKFFKCLNCGKDVYRSAAELRKGTKNVYCSQSCCVEYRKKHKEINPRYTDNNTMQCDYCGKEIRVSSDKQKRDEHHFCSKESWFLLAKMRFRNQDIITKHAHWYQSIIIPWPSKDVHTNPSNSNTIRMTLTFLFFLVAVLFSNSEKLLLLTIYSLNLSINIKQWVTEVQQLYTVLFCLSLQLPVKMFFSKVT